MTEISGNGNSVWKVKQAEFKGFMKAKMESHDNQLKIIGNDIKDIKKGMVAMQVKAATFGALAGIVVSFLVSLYLKNIGGKIL